MEFSRTLDAEFIEALRLSMQGGLIPFQEIVNWADNWLTAEENPPQLLFDISACRDARELGYVLHCYTEEYYCKFSCRLLIANVSQRLFNRSITEQEALDILDAVRTKVLTPVDFDEFKVTYVLSENFYTAKQSFARKDFINEVKEDIKMFFSFFVDYRLDNYEDWPQIHKRVNDHLEAYIVKPRNRRVT